MKQIFLSLMLFISIASFGQTIEDCRTKVVSNGNTITITNKTNCATKYLIERTGYGDSISTVVNSLCSHTLNITFLCGTLSVKPVTNCACGICPYNAVVITNNCNALPLTMTEFSRRNNSTNVEVWFTLSEITNVKSVTINKTLDGKNLVPLKTINISEIKPNVRFKTTIKL